MPTSLPCSAPLRPPVAGTRARASLAGMLIALLACASAPARGADDPLLDAGCGSCHRLDPPEPGAVTVESFAARKAPDLHYAGSKLREAWLREWLRKPTRLRPAGVHPDAHTRTEDGEDVLRPETLEPHPSVPEERLDAVVEALLARRWGEERLPQQVQRTPVPKPLAQMNFVKFKGCGSCHRTSEDYGGVSGPELYTAYERMRPEFLWSYVDDPQAWDPVAPMPGYDLPPAEVGKLVEFLRMLSEERGHGK